MEERTIESVTDLSETDWGDSRCGRQIDGESCTRRAVAEIELTYDDDAEKTFYTLLCDDCRAEYLREWDKAQIFGNNRKV